MLPPATLFSKNPLSTARAKLAPAFMPATSSKHACPGQIFCETVMEVGEINRDLTILFL